MMKDNKMVALLAEQIRQAHKDLDATMADVTEEQVHFMPPGTANPLGATYAHVIFSEDATINGLLTKKKPLSQTTWKNKTGASEPMPGYGPEWKNYYAWTRKVKINLGELRKYAKEVYKQTEAYLDSITDDDLAKEMDFSDFGFGKVNAAWVLSTFITEHTGNITGEIAVLKGIQGAKGYQF
jgi:hypothetical protein